MQERSQDSEIHIADYFMVLSAHRMVIIAAVLICLSLGLMVSFLSQPIFRSTATLVIEKESNASPITGERTDYENYVSQTMTFNTHFKLIKSQPVIEGLIRSLNLDEEGVLQVNPIRAWIQGVCGNIRRLLRMDSRPPPAREAHQALVDAVKEKISIQQVRDTRLLAIQVKDRDPELAARMANDLARNYIEFNLANKMDASKQTLEWMNNELFGLRKKLEDAERAFFQYKQTHRVFSITGKQKMAEQKIVEFNNKYLEARNRRLELDARIAELGRHIQGEEDIAMVRSLVDNPMIDSIYGKIVNLELEFTRLSKVYRGKHSKMVQLKSELEKSRLRLSQEIKKELGNLKSERKVLLAREQNLEKTIAEFESDALDTSSKELKYTILQRNVNTSQNLYDLMVSRVKESNILQSSDNSNIRLVEPAQPPVKPISPNKKRNVLLALFLGLFGGVGLVFFLEYLDRSIHSEEDIHAHFNLPVLAAVPEAAGEDLNGAKS